MIYVATNQVFDSKIVLHHCTIFYIFKSKLMSQTCIVGLSHSVMIWLCWSFIECLTGHGELPAHAHCRTTACLQRPMHTLAHFTAWKKKEIWYVSQRPICSNFSEKYQTITEIHGQNQTCFTDNIISFCRRCMLGESLPGSRQNH